MVLGDGSEEVICVLDDVGTGVIVDGSVVVIAVVEVTVVVFTNPIPLIEVTVVVLANPVVVVDVSVVVLTNPTVVVFIDVTVVVLIDVTVFVVTICNGIIQILPPTLSV